MKMIVAFAFSLVVNVTSFAQDFRGTNQSTSLCGGRWEFFMSDIAVSITFIIDKYTGDILQLVERKEKTLTWQHIQREKSNKDVQKQDLINYQLFSSGLGIRHTYLLNTSSGLTWQLVKGSEGMLFFQLVE